MWDIHDVSDKMPAEVSLAERYAVQFARSRALAALRRRRRLVRLAGALLLGLAVCAVLLLIA